MEGFVRKLATFIPSLRTVDYTTLFRRVQHSDLSLKVTPESLAADVIITVDRPRITITNQRVQFEKRGVRCNRIKVHATIDVG